MSDLVNKVAEILNAPVDLVQRSAEARAAASGVSVDDVAASRHVRPDQRPAI